MGKRQLSEPERILESCCCGLKVEFCDSATGEGRERNFSLKIDVHQRQRKGKEGKLSYFRKFSHKCVMIEGRKR